jgi:hypothetical protein
VNSKLHKRTSVDKKEVIMITSALIELIGWLKEFKSKFSDREQN